MGLLDGQHQTHGANVSFDVSANSAAAGTAHLFREAGGRRE